MRSSPIKSFIKGVVGKNEANIVRPSTQNRVVGLLTKVYETLLVAKNLKAIPPIARKEQMAKNAAVSSKSTYMGEGHIGGNYDTHLKNFVNEKIPDTIDPHAKTSDNAQRGTGKLQKRSAIKINQKIEVNVCTNNIDIIPKKFKDSDVMRKEENKPVMFKEHPYFQKVTNDDLERVKKINEKKVRNAEKLKKVVLKKWTNEVKNDMKSGNGKYSAEEAYDLQCVKQTQSHFVCVNCHSPYKYDVKSSNICSTCNRNPSFYEKKENKENGPIKKFGWMPHSENVEVKHAEPYEMNPSSYQALLLLHKELQREKDARGDKISMLVGDALVISRLLRLQRQILCKNCDVYFHHSDDKLREAHSHGSCHWVWPLDDLILIDGESHEEMMMLINLNRSLENLGIREHVQNLGFTSQLAQDVALRGKLLHQLQQICHPFIEGSMKALIWACLRQNPELEVDSIIRMLTNCNNLQARALYNTLYNLGLPPLIKYLGLRLNRPDITSSISASYFPISCGFKNYLYRAIYIDKFLHEPFINKGIGRTKIDVISDHQTTSEDVLLQGAGRESVELRGAGRESLEPRGARRESVEPQGAGRESVEPQGAGRESVELQGAGRESVELHGVGRESVELQGAGRQINEDHSQESLKIIDDYEDSDSENQLKLQRRSRYLCNKQRNKFNTAVCLDRSRSPHSRPMSANASQIPVGAELNFTSSLLYNSEFTPSIPDSDCPQSLSLNLSSKEISSQPNSPLPFLEKSAHKLQNRDIHNNASQLSSPQCASNAEWSQDTHSNNMNHLSPSPQSSLQQRCPSMNIIGMDYSLPLSHSSDDEVQRGEITAEKLFCNKENTSEKSELQEEMMTRLSNNEGIASIVQRVLEKVRKSLNKKADEKYTGHFECEPKQVTEFKMSVRIVDRSGTGERGQGADFIQEEFLREAMKHTRKGKMVEFKQFVNGVRIAEGIRLSKSDSKETGTSAKRRKYDTMIQSAAILQMKKGRIFNINQNCGLGNLDKDLLSINKKCQNNVNQFITKYINGAPSSSVHLEPIFITKEERIKYHDIANKSKKEIMDIILSLLDMTDCEEAEFLLNQRKKKHQNFRKQELLYIHTILNKSLSDGIMFSDLNIEDNSN